MSTVRVVLAVVGLLGVLVLGEGVARWRGDRLCTGEPGVVFRADEQTGWRHIGGLRGRLGPCDGGAIPAASASTTPNGLLDDVPVVPKPAGVVRVLVLGGSPVEGIGVLANHRVDAVLEQLADAGRGARLDVVNAAVGSYALDNELAWLGVEGRALAPDVVVVVVDPITEVTALSPALIAAAGQRVPEKPFLTLTDDGLAPLPLPGQPLAAATPMPPATGLAAYSALLRALTGTPLRSEAPLRWRAVPPPAPSQLAAERASAAALARAIIERLRDETGALGARLVIALAPTTLELREDATVLAEPLTAAASELGIPLIDLSNAFDSAEGEGRKGRFPFSLNWSTEGHLVAGAALFQFMIDERVLPASIVPSASLFSAASSSDVPALAAGAVRDVLDGPIGHFVVAALLAVCVTWMAALLPAWLRPCVVLALGVALSVVVAGRMGALLGIVGLVAFHQSTRLGRVPALAIQAALIVVLVVVTVPLAPSASARDATRDRFLFALVTNVMALRLVTLAVAWWRGRTPASLYTTMRELLFFPTLLGGPLLSPGALERLAGPPGAVPVVEAGIGRLVASVWLVGLAVCEIAAGQGLFWAGFRVYDPTATSMLGAWAWLVGAPLAAYLVFAGFTDLGTGLARMLGVPLARSFRLPFLAHTPGELWRRWMVSFQRWLSRHVYLPLGGGRTVFAPLAVLAAFVASALWYYWVGLKLLGPTLYPPSAALGPIVWAVIGAVGVLAGRVWERRLADGGAGRVLGTVLTLVLVALAWPAFFLPGWSGIGPLLRFYGRLIGLG